MKTVYRMAPSIYFEGACLRHAAIVSLGIPHTVSMGMTRVCLFEAGCRSPLNCMHRDFLTSTAKGLGGNEKIRVRGRSLSHPKDCSGGCGGGPASRL